MKTVIPKCHLLLLAFTFLVATSFCSATLVQPAVSLTTGGEFGFPADYTLWDSGHYLWLALSPSGALSPINYTVGGAFAWYPVSNASVFDTIYVQSHGSFADNYGQGSGVIQTTLNVPFFMGYYVQNSFGTTFPNPTANDGYGWARLVRRSTGMVLLDSALQNPSGGIIVGTTTTVPEPSTVSLLALSASFVVLSIRRNPKRTTPATANRALHPLW